MAKTYELEIAGDSGWDKRGTRSFPMYFSEPEQTGATPPGILLLIAGYGADATSKVYQKMRNQFADQYNLYVLQCNYLGWEFMQDCWTNEELDRICMQSGVILSKVLLEENEYRYNEMGPFQALDNILAVKSLMDILQANGLTFDATRVGIYGHSHGAYLAHLCNCFYPKLFTDILDNSAWISPVYLKEQRILHFKRNEDKIFRVFDYRLMNNSEDEEIYRLDILYPQFENHAFLLCFHGEADELIRYEEKQRALAGVCRVSLQLVTAKQVDGQLFKSTDHGLGADFLKMFQLAVEKYGLLAGQRVCGGSFDGNRLLTERYIYEAQLVDGIPMLQRTSRESDDPNQSE